MAIYKNISSKVILIKIMRDLKPNDGNWIDYSGGLIFGYKINKKLGIFVEGKYNKYWNRDWHDFKFGINYIIL